jgi:hypothetical protein
MDYDDVTDDVLLAGLDSETVLGVALHCTGLLADRRHSADKCCF